jgi:methyl-accepting chemotaxis protein
LSARIQLIINLAFFIPLIGVSVVTLGLTASASQEQINNEYLTKSKSFAGQISNSLNRFTNTSLEFNFTELTRLAGLDANIFSPGGKLLITSQPEIFENQLLGGLINPSALRRIRKGDKNFVSEEYVGSLNYFVAYSAVYSPGSGNLAGIVALPFFQSASSLERMQISVLANILIIFMILFVILLVTSALVSRWLTYPLTMITQKLGKISLVNTNQPLAWDSNDEIGIMVREYNQMLQKLSENKVELERTQREQAWREIAQQVAHEIKNPLTPMKLTPNGAH